VQHKAGCGFRAVSSADLPAGRQVVRQYVQFIIKRQKPSEVDTTENEPEYYSPPFIMPAYELCGLGVRSQE